MVEAVWAGLNGPLAMIQQVGAVGGCECDALASCCMQCCLCSADVVSKAIVSDKDSALQTLHVALEALHPALVALHSALYGPAILPGILANCTVNASHPSHFECL